MLIKQWHSYSVSYKGNKEGSHSTERAVIKMRQSKWWYLKWDRMTNCPRWWNISMWESPSWVVCECGWKDSRALVIEVCGLWSMTVNKTWECVRVLKSENANIDGKECTIIYCTFWCPTDSCRNASIPPDSTGFRWIPVEWNRNPVEWAWIPLDCALQSPTADWLIVLQTPGILHD